MNHTTPFLSGYGLRSGVPSPVNRMMASFSGDFRQDVDINLGVGYVNERTIPKNLILEAMREVIDNPGTHPLPFNYGGAGGSRSLIAAIRRFLTGHGIGGITPDTLAGREIIIGPSGATSLLESIAKVLEPGIVLTSDPMYYIYCDLLERRGFEVVTVPEDSDGMDTGSLERTIASLDSRAKDIRFIYAVTVGNPTASILSYDRRAAIARIAAELSVSSGQQVPAVFDTAYEHLIHDLSAPKPLSALTCDTNGVVYEIGTLSKILAPAFRIGYMIGCDGPFMRAMVQNTSDVGFSAPLIMQETAAVLLERHIADQIARVNAGYREKARITGDCIRETLGAYLESVTGGRAGFYFYLTFRDIDTREGSRFFRCLARTTGDPAIDGLPGDRKPRVVYVPGEFCVHPSGDLAETGRRQLRLSYGFEETACICRAIGYMQEACEYALRG